MTARENVELSVALRGKMRRERFAQQVGIHVFARRGDVAGGDQRIDVPGIASCIAAAMMRAMMSDGPPGVLATTIRAGRSG